MTMIVAGSALIALPAAAIDRQEMIAVCEDFLKNHPLETEWENACVDAIKEFSSHCFATLPESECVAAIEELGSLDWAAISQPTESLELEELEPSQTEEVAAEPAPVIPSTPNDEDRDRLLDVLRSGESADVLIEFDADDVRVEARNRTLARGLRSLGPDELSYQRAGFAEVKQAGLAQLQGVTVLRDYENLSTSFVRVSSEDALNALLAGPEIKSIYENGVLQHFLAQSLPLIQQPVMAAGGLDGTGTTIAVLDTGVDFTIAPFNCTSAGIPAGCRVVATLEAAPNDFSLDDNGHGTNVSAIAATVAGDADLVVADVFNGATAFFADVATAINWAIAIQPSFNVVAMNLSLGDTTINPATCPGHFLAGPLGVALAAGIQPVIAAGNFAFRFGSFVDGVAGPACVPGVVSVGAVYDANVGGLIWNPESAFQCTDFTSAADQVTCLSQTAPILSLLAPGALVTAGGLTLGGTSQAAPHVAGGWAVMREAFPGASDAQILAALQTGGDPVTDPRPAGGRTTSRLLLPEPEQLLQLGVGLLALCGLRLFRGRTRSGM
jgi:subtilisin family serine protease